MKESAAAAEIARRKARGRGAEAKLKAAAKFEELADRCEKVARQIKQRVAGEPIKDRIVSLPDPDARPIRKGKLGKPNEFGYVEPAGGGDREHQARRAGADPAGLDRDRQPGRGHAAARSTIAELKRLGINVQEVALDGGFNVGPTSQALEDLAPESVFIAGRQEPGSKRTPAGCGATERAPRGGSATSNAATGWTDPASKATKAARSGLNGRSWPTTPTPSPSGAVKHSQPLLRQEQTHSLRTGRARSLRGRFVSHEFFRGK